MKTIIAIPSRTHHHLLLDTLRSIRDTTNPSDVVISVCDDASGDDGRGNAWREAIAQLADCVSCHDQRQGVAASTNDAIYQATRTLDGEPAAVMKVDNDVRFIRRGWLDELHAASVAFPKAGVFAIQIAPRGRHKRVIGAGGATAVRPSGNVNGAAMFITASCFDRIGYFDERFRPYGYADAEYCARCRAAGIDHLYLDGPVGRLAEPIDNPDAGYHRWKILQRKRQAPQWRKFRLLLRLQRIQIKQDYARA